MSKICTDCKVEKKESEFGHSHKRGTDVWFTLNCLQCRRGGRPKGFAGKITDEQKVSLLANAANFGVMSNIDFYQKCGLTMGSQAFYRYIRLDEVAKFLQK